MSGVVLETTFLTNLWATPPDWAQEVFYCAVRAGHLQAGKTHRIERETYPGHEWIYCLKGRGWIQVGGKRHAVAAGDLVWVNCHYPHAYGAVVAEPWEVYWVRAEGRDLDKLARLLQVASQPVFPLAANAEVTALFEAVFRQMAGSRPSDLAGCHAAMVEWIARCFAVRLNDEQGLQSEMPEPVREALLQMRLYYSKPIRVAALAAQVGMAESSFTRQFRKATGTSPIAWLRQERIKQAKRRLLDSDDPIKEVARQVGYSDQYFFSKDFKKMTKLTPSQFREDER
jgi:AraC family transcriptional regulator, arabinose operon regulatory protein